MKSNHKIMKLLSSLLIILGFAAFAAAAIFVGHPSRFALTAASFLLWTVGGFIMFYGEFIARPRGFENNDVFRKNISSRGFLAILVTVALLAGYIILFFGDMMPLSGGRTVNSIAQEHVYSLFEPLSQALRGKPVNQWFVYGTLYTYAVLLFGLRMLMKHRGNRYQMLRTASVMSFQLGFAYIIPALLIASKQPEYYFSYFWPLKQAYLWPKYWLSMEAFKSAPGLYFLVFGAFMSLIGVPTLTYFFGKRWYCSWACGCGGLAETLGDPFRQLSNKSQTTWKIERWMVHGVLLFIVLLTAGLWLGYSSGNASLQAAAKIMARVYVLAIALSFAGIIGVGFYPVMGSRVWCRFGCPQAAILGLIQKYFSRFRITVNGGQCMSCGNCSTYCEMGIDVRWYAQRSQNVVRASCVGCGICSTVCPRGVLRLETGKVFGRNDSFHLKDLIPGH